MNKENQLKKEINSLLYPLKNVLPHGPRISAPKYITFLDNHEEKVYRFFSEAWQADAFAQGDIFLSTLERCRAYEDAEQGDKDEGLETYYVDHISGDSDNIQFVEQAQRLGIFVGEGNTNITFENMSSTTIIPDAYVLCTATDFSPALQKKFGPYCVEITNPRYFFILLSVSLNAESAIWEAASGKIKYADRKYINDNLPNGNIGFVKPLDPYHYQKEFRFLWVMHPEVQLQPFVLKCPKVMNLCRRIV